MNELLEDRIFHWWLPFAAYAALVVCGLFRRVVEEMLFGIAAVALVLLFVGIHNAWDAAVFIAQRPGDEPSASKDAGD